jgi:hypothetical protein
VLRSRCPDATRLLQEVRTKDSWEDTEHLVTAGIAERRTAAKYLRQLEEIVSEDFG